MFVLSTVANPLTAIIMIIIAITANVIINLFSIIFASFVVLDNHNFHLDLLFKN